jgi:hypothetical protein
MVFTQLPQTSQAVTGVNNALHPAYRNYLLALDAVVRGAAGGSLLGALPAASSDASAAALGVPVSGLYQNGGLMRIRLK